MKSLFTQALLLVAFSFALSSTALAQGRGPFIDGVRVEAHLGIGWHPAFGAGVRVEIPIVKDGFLDRADDELAISFGADTYFAHFDDYHDRGRHYAHHGFNHSGFGFWPLAAAQWNFYFDNRWSVFPELGITTPIYWHEHGNGDDHTHATALPLFGGGGRWHFTNRNALVVRIHWPNGFQFGITF